MRSVFFESKHLKKLKERLDLFLETVSREQLIDIKFSTNDYNYVVMVIYEKKFYPKEKTC